MCANGGKESVALSLTVPGPEWTAEEKERLARLAQEWDALVEARNERRQRPWVRQLFPPKPTPMDRKRRASGEREE